jgi:hypothetical protein
LKTFIRAKNPLRFQVTILSSCLYKALYVRGCVGVTCGARGIGKTSLTLAEALAMASGAPLLGVRPSGKLRVWFHSSNETDSQVRQRLQAIAKRNDLPVVAASSVFVTSGTLFASEIETKIRDQQLDCFILDSFSGPPDNLARIADATDCALHITTDTPYGDRKLTRLTFAESRAAKIADGERPHHFKASPECTIYRFEPMDGIGVVVPQDRAAFCRDDDRRNRVLGFLADGPWRADRRSPMWLGYEIARELGLDVSNVVMARQIQDAIDDWCRAGILERYTESDGQRHRRAFLRPASQCVSAR